MFASGTIGSLTSGGTAAQEKAAVQGVGGFTAAKFDVYASYVSGGTQIDINGAVIKNSDGTTTLGECAGELLTTGALTTITVTPTATMPAGTYSVTLTSAKGGSFASSSFTLPTAITVTP